MTADPTLTDGLELVLEVMGAQRRRLFGCPAWFADGGLFAFVHGQEVVLKLDGQDQGTFAETYRRAHTFVSGGRPLRNFVALPGEDFLAGGEVVYWLARAQAYVVGDGKPPPRKRSGFRKK